MRIKQYRVSQVRGFTLTEAAIVLGIVGLILGAIWVAASSVYQNMRIARSSEELLQIAQHIRTLNSTQNTVDPNATTANYISAGVFPSDMVSGTSVINIWGGTVTITPTNAAGTANDGFVVTFGGIPANACADFLTRNTGTGRDTGIVGYAVAANNAATAANNSTFPVNVSTAVGVCTNTSNAVSFTFKLKG